MGEQKPEQEGRTRRSALQGIVGLSLVGAGAMVYDRIEREPNWTPIDIQIRSGSRAVDLDGTVTVSVLSSKEDGSRAIDGIDFTEVGVRFAIYRRSFHPDHATLFERGASPLHDAGHREAVDGETDDFTFHFDACGAFVEDEITEGDMEGRLLIKEDWSLTEEKEGWHGKNQVRIIGGNCV